MTRDEFVSIIMPVSEYYSRPLGDAAIEVYYSAAKEIPAAAFEFLVKRHMNDPVNGKYWPTLAHVLAQASDQSDIEREAAIEFENNPKIDGTGWFDLNQETRHQRELRKRQYIIKRVTGWQNASMIERIAHCERIPLSARKPALEKLGIKVALEGPGNERV